MASMVRVVGRVVLTAAMIGIGATTLAAPASADPDDPICQVMPHLARCAGGPLGAAADPSDPQCGLPAADPICSDSPGAPYGTPSIPAAPAAIPPPIGSDLPGSLNPDGTPFTGAPPTADIGGGISGIPGTA
jgi:hypothetical protein